VLVGADEETVQLKVEKGEVLSLKRADFKKAKLILTDALIAFSVPEGPEQ
jgi:ribosome maturation factor RimP